jgi:hypothetical protein
VVCEKKKKLETTVPGYEGTASVTFGVSGVAGPWWLCDFNQQQVTFPGGCTDPIFLLSDSLQVDGVPAARKILDFKQQQQQRYTGDCTDNLPLS